MSQKTALAETALVERITRRDRQAFTALYDRYAARVYGLALRIVGDEMSAEEITQDVFMRLWKRSEAYQPERGRFSTWLLTITRNLALDYLRRQNRTPDFSTESPPEDLWRTIGDSSNHPSESRWQTLYFALQSLPMEQRQTIELAFYQGMSHRQIAEYLKLPLGTVKTRLRLGMEKLRHIWFEEDESGS